MKNKANKKIDVPKSTTKPLFEISTTLLCIVSTMAICLFLDVLAPFRNPTVVELTYSEGLSFSFTLGSLYSALLSGALLPVLLSVLLLLFRPSGLRPTIGKGGRKLYPYLILSLFGVLAYVVLTVVLQGFGLSPLLTSLLTAFLCSVYVFLLYKMYLEDRTYSSALFWEIFRFAIVGLVAAVFDFLTCYVVQFLAFADDLSWYVTLVATGCGFLVGVVINYLMSTYMVYKNATTGLSRTGKGMALFFVLSFVGLLLGIGIQYLLYDYLYVRAGILFLSYPVDFVIRTLVVMVYNYVTRKLLLYR